MDIFKCGPCKYETHDKSNFSKHNSSKKHKEKMHMLRLETQLQQRGNIHETSEHIYQCDFCKGIYSTAGSLARHKKACEVKIKIESSHQDEINSLKKEYSIIIDNLKKDNQHLKQLYDNDTAHYKNTIDNLKSEINRLQQTLNNAGSIIKTSVSATNYIFKNFKDAPPLSAPEDYSQLTYDRPKGGHEDEYDLSDTEDEDIDDDPGDRFIDKDSDGEIHIDKGREKEKFVEKLLYKHRQKILDEYLGKIIVRHYKKKDPSKQSIFNSDTTRLTYIVRELFTNKKIDWAVDKKGIKTTNYVIKPLLKHIDELIREYIDNKTALNHKEISTEELIANFDNLKSGNEILHSIEKNELSENVLRKISPHFYFIKNDTGLIEE